MLRIGRLVMAYKVSAAILISLGVPLALAFNPALGASGSAPGGATASTSSMVHPSVARSPNFHNRRNGGTFLPPLGPYFSGPSNGSHLEFVQPMSGEINYNYTNKLDVPWDWAHRYPPSWVAPPPPPPSLPVEIQHGCSEQNVTIPTGDSRNQTINVVRC